ncbi:hypothetical protein ACFFIY_06115 [Bhargavaea ullalensis]|uniref:Tetratricopeptide repeat-containing protein n=1 Tax=Bhargavaea ullalensis TaxID=1265685 RepID=A0ABV2GBE1_9BACL
MDILIEGREKLLESCGEGDRQFLYGAAGNLCRIHEQPEKTIGFLNQCVNLAAGEKNPALEIVALIRLAAAYKYDDNHPEAMKRLKENFRE